MLDGAASRPELVEAAAADGQPALGITDHGNMYGVLEFYKACRQHGITPVLGLEAYMAHESRHEAPGAPRAHRRRRWRHRRREALLPPHPAGREPHRLPQPHPALQPGVPRGLLPQARLDWELLEEHHDGVIATTGCLGGHVLQALLRGTTRAYRRPAASKTSSGGTTLRRAPGSRGRQAAPHHARACSTSPAVSVPRCSPPTTATTCGGGRRRPRRPAVRPDRGHPRRPEPPSSTGRSTT